MIFVLFLSIPIKVMREMFCYKNSMLWNKFFLKQSIHGFIGIWIGFILASYFRSLSYENFRNDILYRLCSYRSINFLPNNRQISIDTRTDLAQTFESIRKLKIYPRANLSNERENKPRRKLLLVGVMTAQTYFDYRAKTINETWAKDLDGDLIFFTGSNLKTNYSDIPHVSLPKVDDSYPPQKKSFSMFKFMHDFFGDRYHYFMRADDDSKQLEFSYIGQTGVGNSAEFGHLNLESNENFCMGGPGNLLSTHEDVEIGRCLHKHSGISCTWSYDMQNLFYNNNTIQQLIIDGYFPEKELSNAITIHPIKNDIAMRSLYHHYQTVNYQNLNFRITKYRRILKRIQNEDENDLDDDIITQTSFDQTYFEVDDSKPIVNDFFQQKFYTSTSLNPRKNLDTDLIQSHNRNLQTILRGINRNSHRKGTIFDYNSLHYGYVRFLPSFGIQYVYDFLLIFRKFKGKRLTIPIRKHLLALQTFSEILILPACATNNQAIDRTMVNIIVPLYERTETFKRFVNNLASIQRDDNHFTLTIVLFTLNRTDIVDEIQEILRNHSIKANVLRLDGSFSRGAALQKSSVIFNDEDLLFFLDVDMIFNSNVLHRIRRNTLLNSQVYYPIVFSQYNNCFYHISEVSDRFEPKCPHQSNFEINDDNGYWRQFGYGIVAIYKYDLVAAGGYTTTIKGWGIEDVDLYDRLVRSNLTIFRSVDPDLIHVYHEINCDPNLSLPQFEMCLGTKFFSLGSARTIAKFILKQKIFPEIL
ncbi:Chondroitin sulfate synthase 1 [Sarcoptes scabiei]|uniref:Hexosyltransferase n=1 Tax=Sarcoptes scabiei TaxID=52283 RepID=A0A834RB89_SARSC|nr:Chondroitin sulfate synthase 1 [Sarcoptes scabiei]